MKKLLIASAVLILTTACSQDGGMTKQNQESKVVTATELKHHNYVLAAIDGKPYKTAKNAMSPNIAFGEKLNIAGSMCNNYFGQGELSSDGVLTAKGVGMTRKFCSNEVLNKLDQQIGQLLETGAKVTLKNDNQRLVLSNDQTTLEFELKDFVN